MPATCKWKKKAKVFNLKLGKVISDTVRRSDAVVTRFPSQFQNTQFSEE